MSTPLRFTPSFELAITGKLNNIFQERHNVLAETEAKEHAITHKLWEFVTTEHENMELVIANLQWHLIDF